MFGFLAHNYNRWRIGRDRDQGTNIKKRRKIKRRRKKRSKRKKKESDKINMKTDKRGLVVPAVEVRIAIEGPISSITALYHTNQRGDKTTCL